MQGTHDKPRIAWMVASSGLEPAEKARRRAAVAAYLPEDVGLDLVTPEGAPRFLTDQSDMAAAVSSMSRFASSVDPTEYSVAIIAGAIDPGLEEIRERASVPVVGPFEATHLLARILRIPTSIVTSDQTIADITKEKLATQYPDSHVLSVRNIGISVEEIAAIMHDEVAVDRVRNRIVQISRQAVESDGAGAVQFGCMTFATLGVKELLMKQLGVPVLDPARISIEMARSVAQSTSVLDHF